MGVSRFRHFLIIVCIVSVALNFTELNSGRASYCYLASRELSRFVDFLLQKVKRSNDSTVIENGKRTCSKIVCTLDPLRRIIFWKGPVCYRPLKKWIAASAGKKFRKTLVISWKIFLLRSSSSLQLPRQLGKAWAFLPRNHHGRWSLLSFSSFWTTTKWSDWAGSGGQKLSLQKLSSIRSSPSSERWKWMAADHVCKSTAFWSFPTSLVSAIGGICRKLVSWTKCIQPSWSSHNFSHMLLPGISVDSTCGEKSVKVASHLYCVSWQTSNRPSESQGGSGMYPGFCASSSLLPEKFLPWDWD